MEERHADGDETGKESAGFALPFLSLAYYYISCRTPNTYISYSSISIHQLITYLAIYVFICLCMYSLLSVVLFAVLRILFLTYVWVTTFTILWLD